MAEKDNDDKIPTQTQEPIDDVSAAVEMSFEKTQSLMDIANNTFRELCRSLENEQTKLLQLEERRKKLQDEMQRLKAEIEEEKNAYNISAVESVIENSEVGNEPDLVENAEVPAIPEVSETIAELICMQHNNLSRLEGDDNRFKPLETCYEIDEDELDEFPPPMDAEGKAVECSLIPDVDDTSATVPKQNHIEVGAEQF